MKSEGKLDKAGLGYTLTRLVNREEPLLLTVETPDKGYTLFINEDGIRLDTVRGGFSARIEDYLVRDDILSELDLLQILSEKQLTAKPAEEILEGRGSVSPDDLARLKLRQLEDELLWLLSLTEGSYSFGSVDPAEAKGRRDESVPELQFDIEKLTAAALDRMERFDGISKDFRSEGEFFLADLEAIEGKPGGLGDGIEKQVLESLQGDKPVSEVAQSLELAPFKVFGIVTKYMKEDLVRPLKIEELRQGAKAALENEDLIKALAYLRRAFEREREDPEVVEELGSLFEFAGESKLAAGFFSFLGALHAARSLDDEAQTAWDKALSLDEGNLATREQIFQRRLRSGSGQAAAQAGLDVVARALEAGDYEVASRNLEILQQEEPDSFAVRRKVFEFRAQQQDVEGARETLRELEQMAEAFEPDSHEALTLPSAYMTLARIDPENQEIRQKLETSLAAAKKAARKPGSRSHLVVMAVIVLLLGGGAGGSWWFFFREDPGGGLNPNNPGSKAPVVKPHQPDPHGPRRLELVEEARGFVASEDMLDAREKFEAAMEITPEGHNLYPEIKKELEAVEAAIAKKHCDEVTAVLEKIETRIRKARDEGKRGAEKEIETSKTALAEQEKTLLALEETCPPELSEHLAKVKYALADAREVLADRLFQVLYLRGELEWNKKRPDAETAADYFRRAAAVKGAKTVREKAEKMVKTILDYTNGANDAHKKGTEALKRAWTAGAAFRQTLIDMSLLHLKKVVVEYPKSPLSLDVKYPIWVITRPSGATLHIKGEGEEARSPGLLVYDARKGGIVVASKPGFVPKRIKVDGARSTLKLELDRGLLWSFQVGDTIDRGPSGDGERFFFGARDGGLYAYTSPGTEKARKVWPPFQVRDIGGVKSTPLVWSDNIIFCSANLGEMWALEAATGKKVWGPLRMARSIVHTPAGLPGSPFILVGDIGGTLYAINGKTGALAWQTPLAGAGEGIRSSPVLFPAHSAAFVGMTRGGLIKVNLSDGKPQWRIPTGLNASVFPVIMGNRVLAVAGSRLFGFDALAKKAPSRAMWDSGAFFEFALPVFVGGRLHLTDQNGTYHVLRPEDGKEALSQDFGTSGNEPVTPLVLKEGVVLASGRVLSYWLREGSGLKRAWKVELPGEINGPIIAQQGKAIVTTAQGHCCAVLLK